MQYKGAVFFDYDGTLTDEKVGITHPTETTKAAIDEFRKKGYLAILCTGRAVGYAQDTGVDFDGIITSIGTHATVHGKVIFDKPIPQELFDRFVHRMDEMDVSYGIDNPIKCITKDMDDPVFIDWRETFSIGRDVYRPIEKGVPTVGYKVSLLYRDLSQIEQLKKEFPELTFDVLRTYKCTDVAQKGIDKGTAAMAIIDYFSIPYENTYAFGDGENDYSMLKAVCHGVCMGKHAPCLEEVCETITECVQDEGVANALKRFGLID